MNRQRHSDAAAELRGQLGLDADYTLANKPKSTDGKGLTCEVVTTGNAPYTIKSASASWFKTWGFAPEEAVGKEISVLNGNGTDLSASRELMRLYYANDGHASYRCTNVTKTGDALKHTAVLERQHDSSIKCTSSDFAKHQKIYPETVVPLV